MDLRKFSGEKTYARYSTFTVADEGDKYKLTVGGYSGAAGNPQSLLCIEKISILYDFV